MASTVKTFGISPYFIINLGKPIHSRFPIRCIASRNSITAVKGISFAAVKEESKRVSFDLGNNEMIPNVEENIKRAKDLQEEKLEALWDDGYGSQTVKDYLDFAKELIKPDSGPPRWFTPLLCGPPLRNSPTLIFLPGVDGVGLGLIPHHKALGKVFNVQCLHIPVKDQTPFKELVEYIEQTVRSEQYSAPNKPIYIVGDSLGGCLALAVAARNPQIDLVVILANPATSFNRSQLKPLLPLLEVLPDELHIMVSFLLGFIIGNPMKMARINVQKVPLPLQYLGPLAANICAMLPHLSDLADIVPKGTLLWKLNLLKESAAYANSRLHAVKAEVLVLASGKDNILPSGDEALRLSDLLKNCKIRYFKDNGHALLMEDGINLLTIIKGTCTYRRTRNRDLVMDFLPPSMSEFKQLNEGYRWYHDYTSPVMLSTKEDGTIVRGLAGVPIEGPVLFVGYHMLMGLEIGPLVAELLREKRIMVRGIAHPTLFSQIFGDEHKESSVSDFVRLYGALTVSSSNLFKLLSAKSHVLLYPGGAREALHRKGEEYKLFWPDQPEFVRMAARFGATIVPFGVVGEDDIAELVLDYDDMMKLPIISDHIRRNHVQFASFNVRAGMSGEVGNQPLYLPAILPKIPAGRLYYLFGKPIQTKGRKDVSKDKHKAMELYLQVKSEVENNLSYLLKKRNEDPYRGIIDRTVYGALETPVEQIPTFEL